MRFPVPNNRLVMFTLAGALLTAAVAGALAVPESGLIQIGDSTDSGETAAPQQVATDAPEPNENFTPAVQTQSGHGGGEYGDEEEDEEYEEEYEDEEDDEDEAYE